MTPRPGFPFGSADSAQELLLAFRAMANGQWDFKQVLQLASSHDLALAATEAGCVKLAEFIQRAAADDGEATIRWVCAVEDHASKLDALGKPRQALHLYEAVLPVFRRYAPPERFAGVLYSWGTALQHVHRYQESIVAYDQVITVIEELVKRDDRRELFNGLASALTNKGVAQQGLGRLREAVAAYDRAIAIHEELMKRPGQREPDNGLATAVLNKGTALQSLGRLREAVAAYDRAIAIREELVNQGRRELANDLAIAFMNKSVALQNLGLIQESAVASDRAIGIVEELVERQGRRELAGELSSARLNLAYSFRQNNRADEALTIYRAIDPATLRGDDLRKYYWALSDALWQNGDRVESMQHHECAREQYRQNRRFAGIDETSLEYVAQRQGMHSEAVERYLDLKQSPNAFAVVLDGKAGVLGDQLAATPHFGNGEPKSVTDSRNVLADWLRTPPRQRQGTLRNVADAYFREWRIDWVARNPVPPTLTDDHPTMAAIQHQLPECWAALEFWRTGDKEFIAFLVTCDGLQEPIKLPFPTKLDFEQFHRNLNDFVVLMTKPLAALHPAANDQVLNDLWNWLFVPLRPLLKEKGIVGLYIVPHRWLHFIPLHGCFHTVGRQRRYLGDYYQVAYLPSSGLLPRLPELRPTGPMLSIANPDRGTEQSLPFSEFESRQLRHRAGRFVAGPDATFAATDDWGEFATLHFSCHGLGDPAFAPLSRLYLNDDLLLAHDVVYRRPRLRNGALVVLNGCQTGVRDQRAADEGMGLMSAFLTRGAALVLSTMWSVIDGVAALMVVDFIVAVIDRGEPPVAALCAAQANVRGLTARRYLQRWDEVKAMFPAKNFPAEAGKMLVQKAWVCRQAGLMDEAETAANDAAPLLRDLDLRDEADQLLFETRPDRRVGKVRPDACVFDHPISWGAFQLIGRVTPQR